MIDTSVHLKITLRKRFSSDSLSFFAIHKCVGFTDPWHSIAHKGAPYKTNHISHISSQAFKFSCTQARHNAVKVSEHSVWRCSKLKQSLQLSKGQGVVVEINLQGLCVLLHHLKNRPFALQVRLDL